MKIVHQLQTLPTDLHYLSQFGKIPARYVGLVGDGNLGDEVLSQVICAHFNNRVRLYSPMKLSKTMVYGENLIPYQAYFLGGGTLIKAVSQHLSRLKTLQAKYPKSKFIVFGTGVGDTDMWEKFGIETNIEPWKEVLNNSDYIGVRGPLSKQYLESWGIKKPINVIGDPAILLARKRLKPKIISQSVGLNLGSLLKRDGKFHGGDQEAIYSFYLKLLDYLKAHRFKITFFPMQVSEVEKIRLICQAAQISNFSVYPAYKKPIQKTIKQLEAQDIFIGERLHSAIFASCAYTPTVMLEYRTKCLDFMQSINCQAWNIRTDNLQLDAVVNHIDYFYGHMEAHQNLLFTEMQKQVRTLNNAREDVVNTIAT